MAEPEFLSAGVYIEEPPSPEAQSFYAPTDATDDEGPIRIPLVWQPYPVLKLFRFVFAVPMTGPNAYTTPDGTRGFQANTPVNYWVPASGSLLTRVVTLELHGWVSGVESPAVVQSLCLANIADDALSFREPLDPTSADWWRLHIVLTNGQAFDSAFFIFAPPAATPTVSPSPGIYAVMPRVTLQCDTPGSTIYYTNDGTPPNLFSNYYHGPFFVSASGPLQAMAVAPNHRESLIGSWHYFQEVPAETPTADIGTGVFFTPQTVTLACATPGSSIFYTTNGSTPSSSSTRYTTPLAISINTTLKVIATAPEFFDSAAATFVYDFPAAAATPTASPPAATYSGSQSVVLSSATPGAVIHYTTNGSTPTTGSTVYSSPIPVAANTTIKALAVASGHPNSSIATLAFAIQAQIPVPTPAAGIYQTAQSVALSSTTPGAIIYYTTDGSPPTALSPVYAGPIPINTDTTVKAFVSAPGYADSGVVLLPYSIRPFAAMPVATPPANTYTSSQSVALSTTTPGATIYYTLDGSTPTVLSAVYSAPLAIDADTLLRAYTAAPGFTDSAVASFSFLIREPQVTAPPVITLPTEGATVLATQDVGGTGELAGDLIRIFLDGEQAASTNVGSDLTWLVPSVDMGLPEPPAARPTASPPAGSYATPQVVALSTTTPGGVIRYTLDGSDPNDTESSTVYTTPITVPFYTVLQAVVVDVPGYAASPVLSARYDEVITFRVNGLELATYQTGSVQTSYTPSRRITVDLDINAGSTDLGQATIAVNGTPLPWNPAPDAGSNCVMAYGTTWFEVHLAIDAPLTNTIDVTLAEGQHLLIALNAMPQAHSLDYDAATGTVTIHGEYLLNGFNGWYVGPNYVVSSETWTEASFFMIPPGNQSYDVYSQFVPYVPWGRWQGGYYKMLLHWDTPAVTAAPVATPGSFTFHTATQDVTLSCATPGASIYYSTDGSYPTLDPAHLYTSPITIQSGAGHTQLVAVALAPGLVRSDWGIYDYWYTPPQIVNNVTADVQFNGTNDYVAYYVNGTGLTSVMLRTMIGAVIDMTLSGMTSSSTQWKFGYYFAYAYLNALTKVQVSLDGGSTWTDYTYPAGAPQLPAPSITSVTSSGGAALNTVGAGGAIKITALHAGALTSPIPSGYSATPDPWPQVWINGSQVSSSYSTSADYRDHVKADLPWTINCNLPVGVTGASNPTIVVKNRAYPT